MSNLTDKINPQVLKAARVQKGMTQQQLADAIRCSKDTVSRWERGKSKLPNSYLRVRLMSELRISWEKLTESTNKPKVALSDTTIKMSVGREVRNSLHLVAERYNVRPRDVLKLAPLLFLVVAERSLCERKRRLDKIYETLNETNEMLIENCAHLGGIIISRSVSADKQLEEEEESLKKRDIFGRSIEYENWNEGDEGPFVHFIRGLTKNLPKDAVTSISTFDGDTIGSYEIAHDTLQERTGISEDEAQGQDILHYIRLGYINFVECLRIKQAGDETYYRKWLNSELTRAKLEAGDELMELFSELGGKE